MVAVTIQAPDARVHIECMYISALIISIRVICVPSDHSFTMYPVGIQPHGSVRTLALGSKSFTARVSPGESS